MQNLNEEQEKQNTIVPKCFCNTLTGTNNAIDDIDNEMILLVRTLNRFFQVISLCIILNTVYFDREVCLKRERLERNLHEQIQYSLLMSVDMHDVKLT